MGERLAIEADRIAAVLLADGNWHPVKPSSFEIGTYQFKAGDRTVLGGGAASRLSELGTTWRNPAGDEWFACPLSSILAVRYTTRSHPTKNAVATAANPSGTGPVRA